MFVWFTLACLAGAGALAAAWRWRVRRREHARPPLPTAWPLQSRPVFTADERRVYRQLVEAFPHHVVLAKLPLVRFCQPEEPETVRSWYRLIGSQYVTFALSSPSGRVVAVVDLEGGRTASERSLLIKREVFAACRIRYLRCHADRLPSRAELQLLVPQGASGMRGPQPAVPVPTAAEPPPAEGARRGRRTLWRDQGLPPEAFHGRHGSSATTPRSILPMLGEPSDLDRGRGTSVDLSRDLAEALGDAANPPPMSARH